MRKRRPNHRLVKKYRSYTIDEVACLFKVHENTVRSWVKSGLPICDHKRPILILGLQLASFLAARSKARKQPCQPGEIYCFRCRAPRLPAGQMVDYTAVNEKMGNLTAICPICECLMNQRVSVARLLLLRGKLEVSCPKAPPRLGESDHPSVNSELKRETQP
jgi:hypothetical protein